MTMHNRHYEKWVTTLPCCICGNTETIDPHHLKGDGAGSNLKPSSFLCIPLCRSCHDQLHHSGYLAWESMNGISQFELAAKTMLRAIYEGVLRVIT